MKLANSSFLCLDIGTYGVRGLAHNVRDAKIVQSVMHSVKNTNTIFALNSVIDELEQQLGTHFDSAFITGNFGTADFKTISDVMSWNDEHKITELDLKHQIAKIKAPENFYTMHIIPVFYGTPNIKNINNTPIGHIDTSLKSHTKQKKQRIFLIFCGAAIFNHLDFWIQLFCKMQFIANQMKRLCLLIWETNLPVYLSGQCVDHYISTK